MKQEEIWRDIDGYEGLYQVSNLGKVKSLDRIDCRGNRLKGMILKPQIDHKGYFRVDLHKEGKARHFLIHRLVAQAFIPNPDNLPQINHKDENPKNNRVDNLEWCDGKYNCNYGTRIERQVQTRISNGNADPEMCGIEDGKEYHRMYYQSNKERFLEYNRKWREKNPDLFRESCRERTRRWREKKRDQINERRREQRLKKKQVSEDSLW